jgi:hypothetical protein
VELNKAIQLNPQFAPAYEAIARAYPRTPDGQKLAVNAAIKSVELDPGQLHYAINLTYLLISNNRDAEALTMIKRIRAEAGPSEKSIVDSLQSNYDDHQRWLAQSKDAGSSAQAYVSAQVAPGVSVDGQATGQHPAPSTPAGVRTHVLAIEGVIASADCSAAPQVDINVNLSAGVTTFRAANFASLPVTAASGTSQPSLDTCSKWAGRKVKLWFNYTSGKDYAGEITKIDFF